MRTLKLTIAYDGTNYVGWQHQDNGLSVQQVIEEALGPFQPDAPDAISLMGASRTDAGVHAAGQVGSVRVRFDTPADAVRRGLNIRLPADVRILDVQDAAPSFHARFDALGKAYRYRIATTDVLSPFARAYVWHLPYRLDIEGMRRAAAALTGTHDFAAFQARGTTTLDTVRTIEQMEILESPGELQVLVEGTGFLRHMVRIMVGSLVDVGAGRRPPEWMAQAVASRARREAGPTAPALGLSLERVRY